MATNSERPTCCALDAAAMYFALADRPGYESIEVARRLAFIAGAKWHERQTSDLPMTVDHLAKCAKPEPFLIEVESTEKPALPRPKKGQRFDCEETVSALWGELLRLDAAGKLSVGQIQKLRGGGGIRSNQMVRDRFREIKGGPAVSAGSKNPAPAADTKPVNLTEAQFERLDRLAAGKPLGVTAIADEFKVDKPTAAKMLIEYQNSK